MSALLAVFLAMAGPARADVFPSASYYEGSDPSAFKKQLTVSFVNVRGSGWTREQAERQFERVVRVWAQCGICFADAEYLEMKPPAGTPNFLKFHAGERGSIEELGRANPSDTRPVFYLIGTIADLDDDAGPFSRADFNAGPNGDPVLFDSIFLPFGINHPRFDAARALNPYSVAAHELWHVLTREGQHYREFPEHLGNIWLNRSDFITPRDCRLANVNPLLKPL